MITYPAGLLFGSSHYLWLEVLLISAGVALGTTLAYKYFTNQAVMREIKKEQKALQDQMKTSKDQPEKMMEINKKSMKLSGAYFKHSMKATLITFIPFIILFSWLKNHYACKLSETVTQICSKEITQNCCSNVLLQIPGWTGHLGWFGLYFIFTMVFTSLFRKLLKVA